MNGSFVFPAYSEHVSRSVYAGKRLLYCSVGDDVYIEVLQLDVIHEFIVEVLLSYGTIYV